MKRRLVLLLSIFSLVWIAACSPATQGSPLVWIDAPLDGSILPLAPYPVVAHANSPDGIARFAFSVNDGPAVECAGDAAGASADGTISACLLSHVNPFGVRVPISLRATWSPPAPGKYVLRIRAQNAQGIWGAFAEAKVTVGGETPTPTATPAVTEPSSATASPTPTSTLTLTPAGLIFFPGVSTNEFHYIAQNVPQCSPLDLFLTVKVSDPGRVNGMLLFFHLQDQAGGGSTGWNSGVPMNRLADGSYSLSVASDSISRFTDYLKAWLIYQFVAADAGGKVLGRSDVYSNVTLSMCPP
jgi:hypothetical protein